MAQPTMDSMWSAFPKALVLYAKLTFGAFLCGRNSLGRLSLKRAVLLLLFLPLFLVVQFVHWFCFLLDEILFRGYRRIDIREPLFVVGVPRSGTTFLHRLLSENKTAFTTTPLWELIFAPSITEKLLILGLARIDRWIGRPFGRLFVFFENRSLGALDAIHGTSLSDPEEDYFFLVPIIGCFLLVLPFPFSGHIWRLSRFDTDMPDADKRRYMAFYKACVQKHLYVRGRHLQYLSKNPSFSSWIIALRETFPDCKIVGCTRNPYKVIPSLLSSMTTGAEVFNNDPQGDEYRDRLVDMLNNYYRHLTAHLPEMPQDRHALVTMESLVRDPQKTVTGLYERFGWPIPGEYEARLCEETERSRSFKSRHSYTLSQFGLTHETLREDFGFVFSYFAFDTTPPS